MQTRKLKKSQFNKSDDTKKIVITRSSVCAGDDCGAPHLSELYYENDEFLSDFMTKIAEYLPSMNSVKWDIRCERQTIGYLISDDSGVYEYNLPTGDIKIKDLPSKKLSCFYHPHIEEVVLQSITSEKATHDEHMKISETEELSTQNKPEIEILYTKKLKQRTPKESDKYNVLKASISDPYSRGGYEDQNEIDLLYETHEHLSDLMTQIANNLPPMPNVGWKIFNEDKTIGYLVSDYTTVYQYNLQMYDVFVSALRTKKIECLYMARPQQKICME